MSTRKNVPGTEPGAVDELALAEAEIEERRAAAVAARATVDRLKDELRQVQREHDALGVDRNTVAYAALAEGDPAAQERLAEIHRMTGETASKVEALTSAVIESGRRDEAAQNALTSAIERRKARQVLQNVDRVARKARELDSSARAYFAQLADVVDELNGLARSAAGRPSMTQLTIFLARAIRTHAGESRHVLDLGVMAPSERTTFAELIGGPGAGGWLGAIDRWARERLAAAHEGAA